MALPWTLPDPKRDGARGGKYDCETCRTGPHARPPVVRAGMHCGFMPRNEWREVARGITGGLPKKFGPFKFTADMCPGWLVQQPAVIEGVKAYSAAEAHMLERVDPFGLRVVTEAVMLVRRAFNAHTEERQQRELAQMRSG